MKLLYIYGALLVFVCSGSAWSNPPQANKAPIIVEAAKATPNPVTGTGRTAALSVLAGDDAGEDKLVYTWKVLSLPPGSMVTFSVNHSNAAKNTTATLSRAGIYTLSVTVVDKAGLSVTSDISVIVKLL
jgi:hypothetical protein